MTRSLQKGGMALALGLVLGALVPLGVAFAQEADDTATQLANLAAAVDAGWVLITATLVIFMQAGFAFVEGGFVRVKNTGNILMKNVLDAALGGMAYWAVGFGLAFGTAADFMGTDKFFFGSSTTGGGLYSAYVPFGESGAVPFAAFWFFQFAFAATAATIVSGAMAERTKFSAYLFYTVFITGFIYPIVSHWVWGGGWLSTLGANGFKDFAGSTVVHSVGGWSALMGAMIVGARIGKYGAKGEVRAIPGHSLPLAVLGTFILWIGWYGFNPGSTLGLSGGFASQAAIVAMNTTLAACAGCAAAMAVTKLRYGKYDIGLTMNGLLGGLVGITAGCAFVEPWAAVVIGAVAGGLVVASVAFFDRLRIDDPVGAISVHAICGVFGTLAVGLFASDTLLGSDKYGLLVGGGAEQLGVQAVGVLAVAGWALTISGLLFLALKFSPIGLRVSEEEELGGLDVPEHGIGAYPEFPTVVPGAAVETAFSPAGGSATMGHIRTGAAPAGGGD